MYQDIISSNLLFTGLKPEEYQYAQNFYQAEYASYQKGELLSRLGQPLRAFGLVLSGNVQVFMEDCEGQPVIMANVGAGETFGESLCFLEWIPQVYICANTDVEVLWLKTNRMKEKQWDDVSAKERCKEGIKNQRNEKLELVLMNRFIGLLSTRALAMNERIQILSKITLRDKLITFFSREISSCNSRKFEVPFNRNDMAVYLGTNRSALSRELSKMQSEGILKYHGKKFEIVANATDKA